MDTYRRIERETVMGRKVNDRYVGEQIDNRAIEQIRINKKSDGIPSFSLFSLFQDKSHNTVCIAPLQ